MFSNVTAYVDPLTLAKTVAMLVLGLGSFALGVAPLALARRWRSGTFSPHRGHRRHQRQQHQRQQHQHQHQHPGDAATGSKAVSLMLCFGGGVLLCTTLLHLQPEARDAVAALQRDGRLHGTELLGDLLFCAGFFMVLVVDEVAHAALDRCRCCVVPTARPATVPPRGSPCFAAAAAAAAAAAKQDEDEPLSASVSLTSFGDVEHGRTGSPEQRQEHQEQEQEQQQHRQQQQQQQQQQEQQLYSDSDSEKKGDRSSLRGLLTVLALSFHEVFEGLAVGLESRVDHVWYLFAAVATHKLVIAFCVGMELAWTGTRRAALVAYAATFAVVTPLGIGVGMAIARLGGGGGGGGGSGTEADAASPGPVAVVLQALAAGTLLYVVFFEVLARHRRSGWSHLAAVAAGFCTLFALQMLTPHNHGHNHDSHDFGHNHYQGQDHEHGQGQEFGHSHDHVGHGHQHGHSH